MFEDKLRRRLRRWQQQRPLKHRDSLDSKKQPRKQWGGRASKPPFARIDGAHRSAPSLSAQQTGSQLDRGREVDRDEGQYLLIERPLVDVFASAAALMADWRPSTQRVEPDADARQLVISDFQTHYPDRALFLDLETCGLAGAAIFLAGLIRFHAGQLVVTQLWARTYAEEAALIGALGDIVRANRVLVTFNGKSFDWPQVRDRTTRFAAAEGTLPELEHFDLLHYSRRKYGRQFGDCRLQTLERHVFGRRRFGDIPGREIPGVYAEYVRTGNTQLVEPILHHNALDLVTLWQLALRISDDRWRN